VAKPLLRSEPELNSVRGIVRRDNIGAATQKHHNE
jgi:hypothetical protein